MTIVTALIGYGVADLARKVTDVLFMLRITLRVGPNVLVTVFAFYRPGMIPIGSRLSHTVEFGTVALAAGHPLL